MVYEWKKGLWKLGKAAIYVVLAGVASVYGNNPTYLAIAPLLTWGENYIKHR